MATVPLADTLRLEYARLFNSCAVRPERAGAVDKVVSMIESGKARYQQVAGQSGIPWGFVAAIHNMESSLNFTRHLHNGDPLTKRTVQVPAGRPISGSPPFTWEESAIDALTLKKLGPKTDWSLSGTLYHNPTTRR